MIKNKNKKIENKKKNLFSKFHKIKDKKKEKAKEQKNMPEISARPFSNFRLGEEKNYFIENLSMLLASGMNILQALDGIEGELTARRMKEMTVELRADIQDGMSIWRALEKTQIFSTQVISLIRVGEQSGRLSENLDVINAQQKKDQSLRSKIRSAIMYPVFIIVMMVVVGFGISWFILPRLAEVFDSLDMELPVTTKILIAVGTFLGDYGVYVVPTGLILVLGAIYMIFINPKTKYLGYTAMFNFPITRKLIQQVELSRFGYILGTLLKAGLPVDDSLDALTMATEFRPYAKLYQHMNDNVEVGHSFKTSFDTFPESKKLIPSPVQQMIASGEQSGSLSEVLIRVGQNYEEKTETTTKDLPTALEPILLVVVWVGVVGIAMSVIMPIYSLIGDLNG